MRPLKVFALLLPLFLASNAHAIVQQFSSRIALISQSAFDNTAHWINPVLPVNSVCTQRLWIPYEDKEMFATALTAQLNKMVVEGYYDTAAATKSFPGYGGSSPCRLIALNLKYIP